MIKAYPKIFAIGQDYIRDIFNEEVEITEKVDGSQFVFGKIRGHLYMRSKGQQLFAESPEKMFREAIEYVNSIESKVPEDYVFYCEYLKRPKHNTLKYERIPRNHLVLFGVMDKTEKNYTRITEFAETLEVDRAPVIYRGKIENIHQIVDLLDRESFLGGVHIEGVVVKNYSRQFLLGGQPMPLMAGKFVSEKFKEVHRERWGQEEKSKGRFEVFLESFRTEARWEKAIQHLMEKNELLNAPQDIGKLIKEIHLDIEEESKEEIKEWLWGEFGGQVKRKASAGFPEWYKLRIAKSTFGKEDSNG